MKPAHLALLPALLALSSCIHTSYVPLGGVSFDPRPVDHQILVYETEGDVPRDYYKVARLVGNADEIWGIGAIVEEMKRDARALGADAIILRGTEQQETYDDCGNVMVANVVVGVAIRWCEDSESGG